MYKGFNRPHLSTICPAKGAKRAIIMEGIVSISFDKNSMLGISENVWLMRGKEETTVIPDMMPSVATRSKAVWMRLVLLFIMGYDSTI